MHIFAFSFKRDKDKTIVTSYCPLSLRNSDQYIIGKVMANKLNQHLCFIHCGSSMERNKQISSKKEFSFSNTFYIIYTIGSFCYLIFGCTTGQICLTKFEWRYMFATFEKFSFNNKFMTVENATSPKSSILTNCNRCHPFMLRWRTRQGCCLSLLFFALALEALAISI